jgi:hypothetical protein
MRIVSRIIYGQQEVGRIRLIKVFLETLEHASFFNI